MSSYEYFADSMDGAAADLEHGEVPIPKTKRVRPRVRTIRKAMVVTAHENKALTGGAQERAMTLTRFLVSAGMGEISHPRAVAEAKALEHELKQVGIQLRLIWKEHRDAGRSDEDALMKRLEELERLLKQVRREVRAARGVR